MIEKILDDYKFITERIISNIDNIIKLKIDTKKTTVSKITLEYSKLCEIKDINVIENNIDDIIYKLYKDYQI